MHFTTGLANKSLRIYSAKNDLFFNQSVDRHDIFVNKFIGYVILQPKSKKNSFHAGK